MDHSDASIDQNGRPPRNPGNSEYRPQNGADDVIETIMKNEFFNMKGERMSLGEYVEDLYYTMGDYDPYDLLDKGAVDALIECIQENHYQSFQVEIYNEMDLQFFCPMCRKVKAPEKFKDNKFSEELSIPIFLPSRMTPFVRPYWGICIQCKKSAREGSTQMMSFDEQMEAIDIYDGKEVHDFYEQNCVD
ncbi:hypothetical protein ED733_001571 [Metarhizium rileyi]|uniref:Uncharacterized protein n=1 Tax=Metarhizium rileyi (strain RCEF 4871) TaxID=1649241 RepID=A0A5C6G5D8_METRR|nr:hypothetical protein ED733_001571 [Metarhizium rileyi]